MYNIDIKLYFKNYISQCDDVIYSDSYEVIHFLLNEEWYSCCIMRNLELCLRKNGGEYKKISLSTIHELFKGEQNDK